MRRKLLRKSKDDILIQPRKIDDVKMTAKELERAKKWRDMAVMDRPNRTVHYRFPVTKKVKEQKKELLGEKLTGSWCNERSREFLIVGELLCGMNFLILKLLNSMIEKLNSNL